jgi:hypothetical protein
MHGNDGKNVIAKISSLRLPFPAFTRQKRFLPIIKIIIIIFNAERFMEKK